MTEEIITPEVKETEKPPFDFTYIANILGMCAVSDDQAIHPGAIAAMEIVANDEDYLEPFSVALTTHAGHQIDLSFEEMAVFEGFLRELERIRKEMMARQAGSVNQGLYNQIASEVGLPIIGESKRRKH
jgi:hypothetical protein